jgi:nucleoid-associated protein YgaU
VSVTFREYKSLEEQITEMNRQSSDHTKIRIVVQGDTLSRIAAEEYGDPAKWRKIAYANPAVIDSPRRLTPGTALSIPPIDEFAEPVVTPQ